MSKCTKTKRELVAEFLQDFHGEWNDCQIGSIDDYLADADTLLYITEELG